MWHFNITTHTTVIIQSIFEHGIDDMNLVDIVEMLCDWKAASLRHHDGNLLKSIEFNAKRFNYDDQLKHILLNTAKLFDELE